MIPLELDRKVESVERAMALIGGRWRPAIMYFLIIHGTQRHGQLRRMIPGISQRMLTKQLREMEEAGLVHRECLDTVPPHVEYSITPKGRTLEPIYRLICEWMTQQVS